MESCSICHQAKNTHKCVLPCSHSLHRECIAQLVGTGSIKCPLCRSQFIKYQSTDGWRSVKSLISASNPNMLKVQQAINLVKIRKFHDRHPTYCLSCVNMKFQERARVRVRCRACRQSYRMHEECLQYQNVGDIICFKCDH